MLSAYMSFYFIGVRGSLFQEGPTLPNHMNLHGFWALGPQPCKFIWILSIMFRNHMQSTGFWWWWGGTLFWTWHNLEASIYCWWVIKLHRVRITGTVIIWEVQCWGAHYNMDVCMRWYRFACRQHLCTYANAMNYLPSYNTVRFAMTRDGPPSTKGTFWRGSLFPCVTKDGPTESKSTLFDGVPPFVCMFVFPHKRWWHCFAGVPPSAVRLWGV